MHCRHGKEHRFREESFLGALGRIFVALRDQPKSRIRAQVTRHWPTLAASPVFNAGPPVRSRYVRFTSSPMAPMESVKSEFAASASIFAESAEKTPPPST